MKELDDRIIEREEAFTDDWFMVRKMDRTPTFAEAIEWADTHPNWIKVEDRLPEAKYRLNEKGYSDGVLILVREPLGFTLMDAIYDYETGEWYDRNDDVVCGNITHWMPIVLPKEE